MSSLTSLLARDRIVLVSKIEEALQHQVIAGGDIETVLLEMNLVAEDVLSAYRAALFDRLPATREETMRASRDAIRSLSRENARRMGAIPLQLEGHSVVVAVAEPLAKAARDEIAAALGREVSERIITRPRFAAALAYHYGFELDPRTRRLTDALRRRDPGIIPYVRPPEPNLRPRAPMAPVDTDPPFVERSEEVDAPLGHERSPTVEPTVGLGSVVRVWPTAPGDDIASPISAKSKPTLDMLSVPFGVNTAQPAHVSPTAARRGPLDLAESTELLVLATQRDEVLLVLLRFAQQFFDFVAIFSIGRGGARGRMAHGAGLSPELMERVIVPIDGPGLLARAAREKRSLVGDLSVNDEERAAAALLGRSAGRPGIAIPIVLGTRTVLLVYAERSGEGLSTEDGHLLAVLVPPLAEALRRLIAEQKALRYSSSTESQGTSPQHRPSSLPPEDLSFSQLLPTYRADVRTESDAAVGEAASAASDDPEGGFSLELPTPVDPSDDLQAVDIDQLSRVPEWRRDTRRERIGAVPVKADQPDQEGARGRLQGVPRAAPPPPQRESMAPPAPAGRADGSYHYASSSGAILEETTRSSRSQPKFPTSAQGQDELMPRPAVGSAVAQVKPRRVLIAKSTPAVAPADATPALGRSGSASLPNVSAPSVIIDMGSQVSELAERLLSAESSEEPSEIGELVRVGEAALPVLLQLFPGPLWFDRSQPHKRRPRGRDVSAVARALVAFGPQAAPYLASKVHSDDADTCFYALMVAAEIPHAEVLDAVARRVLDADEEIRLLAIETLRGFAFLPEFETVLNALAQLSERAGKDPRRQRVSIEALGQLRDRRGLNALLSRLSDETEVAVQAAHRALVLLTCQDFGLAQRKWETWAEQWGAAHRIEWLIEALMHADEATRTRAGEELKQATQQYFGYHPQLPKRDRELTQRKYRDWWDREGRGIFGAH